MSVKNFISNIMKDKFVLGSIIMTIAIVTAIIIVTFTPFKQIPFIYNEF